MTPLSPSAAVPLPEGADFVKVFYRSKPDRTDRYYTADEMRAYGRACALAAMSGSASRVDTNQSSPELVCSTCGFDINEPCCNCESSRPLHSRDDKTHE